MNPDCPRARADAPASARLRCVPEDFVVDEVLGFEPEGHGEHLYLNICKRGLGSEEVLRRVALWADVAPAAVGISGRKDRDAVTSQWFSVQLPGMADPDIATLNEPGVLEVLASARHPRKLRRGVHRANAFRLRLREVTLRDSGGGRPELESRLADIARRGVPNYFGEQRFGRGGSNLEQAEAWRDGRSRPRGRLRRGMLLSALRSRAFNTLLAGYVMEGSWDSVRPGDVCMLAGTRSLFTAADEADLATRAAEGDVHLALPLPGSGRRLEGSAAREWQEQKLSDLAADIEHLERFGLAVDYRAARMIPGDFGWDFCEDDGLDLTFTLPAGGFATALVAELLDYWITERKER